MSLCSQEDRFTTRKGWGRGDVMRIQKRKGRGRGDW